MKNTLKNTLKTAGVCAVFAVSLAHAQSDKILAPADFAYRASINSPAGETWLRLALPPAALAQLQTADARDLQVFDAQGQALPYWLAPMTQTAPAAARFSQPYPAHPYGQKQAQTDGGGSLHLSVKNGTQSIAIDSHAAKTAGEQAKESAVLLDLRGEKTSWQALALDADLPPNQPVAVQLATSRDMQHWQALAADGLLYRFAAQGAAPGLENLRLRLPAHWQPKGQYLRISWVADAGGLHIRGLRGELAQTTAAPNWARISLGAGQAQSDGSLQWQLPFALSLQGLEASWQQGEKGQSGVQNSPLLYLPYRLEARKAATAPWQAAGSGLLWRTPVAEGLGISLTGSWQALRFQGLPLPSGQAANAAALQLTALVAPVEIVVLAGQGQAPYTLALGRQPVRGENATLGAAMGARLRAEQLPQMGLTDWRQLPTASLGAAQITPAATGWWGKTLAAWQRDRRPFVLWAILGAGVLLLGGVAWRLARGMQNAPKA